MLGTVSIVDASVNLNHTSTPLHSHSSEGPGAALFVYLLVLRLTQGRATSEIVCQLVIDRAAARRATMAVTRHVAVTWPDTALRCRVFPLTHSLARECQSIDVCAEVWMCLPA